MPRPAHPGEAFRHAGTDKAVSKLSTWLPKKLRLTVTSRPPMSAWPPCFWPGGGVSTGGMALRYAVLTQRTVGEEDESGAGAPDGPPASSKLAQCGQLRAGSERQHGATHEVANAPSPSARPRAPWWCSRRRGL